MQESGRVGSGWCCFGAPKRAVDLIPCKSRNGRADIGRDFPAEMGGGKDLLRKINTAYMLTMAAGYSSTGTFYRRQTARLFQCALRLSKGGVAPVDFDEKDHFWKQLADKMDFAMGKHSLKVMTVSEKKDTHPLAAQAGANLRACYVGPIPLPTSQPGTSPQSHADRPDVKRKASAPPTMLPPPPPKCRKSEAGGKFRDSTISFNGLPYRSLANLKLHQEMPDQARSSSSASQGP